MKLDCVRCNKCGKVHSVEKGCDLPEAEASAEPHNPTLCWAERIRDGVTGCSGAARGGP